MDDIKCKKCGSIIYYSTEPLSYTSTKLKDIGRCLDCGNILDPEKGYDIILI